MRVSAVNHVLDKLIQARLVHLSPANTLEDEQIELTHEALIHSWFHYQRWLEEEELKRYGRWHLAKDAQDWSTQGQPADLLLQKRRIDETKAYENLTPLEQEFIQASEKRLAALQEQEKGQRDQLKLLEDALETAADCEYSHNLRLHALETELKAVQLREASQASRLKELEDAAAELSVQKRRSQRDRLLAVFCLLAAIAATGIAIFESRCDTQPEIRQIN